MTVSPGRRRPAAGAGRFQLERWLAGEVRLLGYRLSGRCCWRRRCLAAATITRQLVEHPHDRGLSYRSTKRPRSKGTVRHSFATAALRARVPVEVVAARLGNTPRVVQEVYSHVIPADDQAAAQLVGDLYRRDVTNL